MICATFSKAAVGVVPLQSGKQLMPGMHTHYNEERALEMLRVGSGIPGAQFREGQSEAIRQIVEGAGRLLVVQKTGWGKSFVYFIGTRLLRDSGFGSSLTDISTDFPNEEPDSSCGAYGRTRRHNQFRQYR